MNVIIVVRVSFCSKLKKIETEQIFHLKVLNHEYLLCKLVEWVTLRSSRVDVLKVGRFPDYTVQEAVFLTFVSANSFPSVHFW